MTKNTELLWFNSANLEEQQIFPAYDRVEEAILLSLRRTRFESIYTEAAGRG